MLYPCKSGWNLPTSSWDMVHTSTFWLKFGSLSPQWAWKFRSRSPKPNQLFIMSQCYIHANLVKIHPPVHEISCKQESVTPTESAPKTICPPPLVRKCKIFVIQGQVTPKWVVWSGPKSNSCKLLCLSWLPAILMMIRSKMNKLAWRHHFPI